ncbi:MAG: hypothetical protein LBE55_03495 [Clostridiales bacterium]|nr:hypothetical protein [Clostridiales bacterium]
MAAAAFFFVFSNILFENQNNILNRYLHLADGSRTLQQVLAHREHPQTFDWQNRKIAL